MPVLVSKSLGVKIDQSLNWDDHIQDDPSGIIAINLVSARARNQPFCQYQDRTCHV